MNPNFIKAQEEIQKRAGKNPKHLNLANLGLHELPDSLFQLTSLKSLNLSNNKISTLDERFATLKKLSIIKFDNGLFPDGISYLKAITNISAVGCNLEHFPQELIHAVSLEKLQLDFNQIKTFPQYLIELEELSEISLSNNQIEYFPSVLLAMPGLSQIDLSNNSIKRIPSAIASIKNLNALDLSDNQIEFLPESMVELNRLFSLNVSDNHIQKIPASIKKMPNLRFLLLKGNFDHVDIDYQEELWENQPEEKENIEIPTPEIKKKIADKSLDPEVLKSIIELCLNNKRPDDLDSPFLALISPMEFDLNTLIKIVEDVSLKMRKYAFQEWIIKEKTNFQKNTVGVIEELVDEWRIFSETYENHAQGIDFLSERDKVKEMLDYLGSIAKNENKHPEVLNEVSALKGRLTSLKRRHRSGEIESNEFSRRRSEIKSAAKTLFDDEFKN